jgi:hypothetical protein
MSELDRNKAQEVMGLFKEVCKEGSEKGHIIP